MGKKGGSSTQMVVDYYLAVHYALCQGPIDTVRRIRANGKIAHYPFATESSRFTEIRNRGLFGGPKREGGVEGEVYFQMGDFTQRLDPAVAAMYPGSPHFLDVLGYRGLATAFFKGREGEDQKGFYWSSNQPFVPAVEFEVTRGPKGWYESKALIPVEDRDRIQICFALDRSGSMNDDEKKEALDEAMGIVLDQLLLVVQGTGVIMDIQLLLFNTNAFEIIRYNVDAADIDFLKANIVATAPLFSTHFASVPPKALAFFESGVGVPYDARIFIFVTDGGADDGDEAAALMSNMLDRTTGSLSTENGTAVECYAFNIQDPDTTETAKLDNTPRDNVPVLPAGDATAILNALSAALYPGQGPDANPAHMIREIITDDKWGRGIPSSLVDDDAFEAAADTLYEEDFGLSMLWRGQDSAEAFIGDILDHIGAVVYESPQTGKLVLKLIRKDYTIGTLPVFDESNSEVITFSRGANGEAVNEIVVTYTDYRSSNESSVTVQDLGSIIANGGQVRSDNRNYHGIRKKSLAAEVAARDLSIATADVATAEVRINRTAWNLNPGDVFKLTSEEDGADEMIVRVNEVKRGRPGSRYVEVTVTEDIFSLDRPEFIEIPDSEDPVGEAQPPTSLLETLPFTLNWFFTSASLSSEAATQADYPDAYVAVLGMTDNPSASDFELVGETVDLAGQDAEVLLGTKEFSNFAGLPSALAREAESTIADFSLLGVGRNPKVGGFGLIGDPGDPEADFEIVLFTAFSGGNWTARRGVLDTVPKAWSAGARIRFFDDRTPNYDPVTHADTEEIDYKALMSTPLGQFPTGLASTVTYTATDRTFAPYRPANVKVEGEPWDIVLVDGLTDFDVTWSNRNRLTEDAVVLAWNEATVTPEAGQTTEIDLIDADTETVFDSVTEISGTSHTIDVADLDGHRNVILKVYAARDGIRSFCASEHLVKASPGFGYNFGNNFGSP